MFRKIDDFLNSITMYRLIEYGLLAILSYSVVLGFTGVLFFSGPQILLSAGILYLSCLGSNFIFAKSS